MIISHKHAFIFVKTRKTAGTSVQEALSRVCGCEDIVTPTGITSDDYVARNFRGWVNPASYLLARPRRHKISRIARRTVERERFFDHMSLSELYSLPEGRDWSGYFKFCIERNPWDKIASRYYWKFRGKEARCSFDEYVETLKNVSDFDLYSLDDRSVAVDYIGRYEDLAGSLAEIARRTGIKLPELRFRNSGTRRTGGYRPLYSEKSKRIVETMFHREIDLLGYSF